MNVAAPFVRRPIGTSLLAAALALCGVLAFLQLPVAPLPKVDFPTLMVSASLPGASPETMATAVATPLERRFGRIAGVSEMTSSSSDGSTTVVLQFDVDRDVQAAARDVQAAIQASLGDLPTNLPTRPSFRKVNPADAPMMGLALTSDTQTPGELYDLAAAQLVPSLSRIEGVGEVFVAGSQGSAIRVRADAEQLAAAGLSMADVRRALATSNAQAPLGVLERGGRARWVVVDDQRLAAASYADVPVAVREGTALRLGDVATVEQGVENDRQAAWFDGRRSVLLLLRRQAGANVLATVDRVRGRLPDISAGLPGSARLDVALDQSHTIRASIGEVERSLLLSVLLVVAVVFAFLRDVRASCVPSVTVPLSLLGTFAGMHALGLSLDNLSLMALTICVGFVVDDAIVVTETIVLRMRTGEPARAAALGGTRAIGFTIVSITASLLAVFVPLLGMGGMVGRLFQEFSLVLSLAVAWSAVVSLTVTPTLAAVLLRPAPAAVPGEPAQGRLAGLYRRSLRWTVRRPGMMALVLAGSVVVSVQQFRASPKGLFPKQDNGLLMVMAEGPPDTSFAAMADKHRAVLATFQADAAVSHTVGFVSGNSGMGFVSLRPRRERPEGQAATLARLRRRLAELPGVRTFIQPSQDLRIGGRASRTQFQFSLQGRSLASLRQAAPAVQAALQQLPMVRDVASDLQDQGRELFVRIDRDALAERGFGVGDVDAALYDAFGQRQVGLVFGDILPRRIVLSTQATARGADSFDDVWLAGAGGSLPLASMATLERRPSSLSVAHQGQLPTVTLSFDLAAGTSLGDAEAAVRRTVDGLTLPEGVYAEFAGTARAFAATQASIPWLLLASVLAVVVVLGVLYESVWHPLTILSTLPSAGLGALLTLRVAKEEFGVLALIGLVLLIGIVKKNAIMVVDVALARQRQHGEAPADAVVAACMERCRPILMTSAAAFLGALPLAFGGGAGSELRRPLGLALCGGLMLSQWVTLYSTPAIYVLIERGRRACRRVVSR